MSDQPDYAALLLAYRDTKDQFRECQKTRAALNRKLVDLLALARKYETPAANVGCHALAAKFRQIIEA